MGAVVVCVTTVMVVCVSDGVGMGGDNFNGSVYL